jgi:putative DNA primase/helicase
MPSAAAEAALARALIRRMLAGTPPPDPLPATLHGWADSVAAIAQAWQDRGPDGAAKALEAMRQAQSSVARLMAIDPLEAAIELLAALPLGEYDRIRILEAEALGIRVTTLDRLITQARGDPEEGEAQGQTITFPDDDEDPWPEPVDGAALLEAIAATFHRYVVLPPGGAVAESLWTVHTHALGVTPIAPSLALLSPQRRCGKTTNLQILTALVARALSCSNITPAAIFRTVERYGPTLILDEADTYLRPDHDDLRGILNSGHTRATAYVIRTVGDDHEPRRFSTWCAKAIALIGTLPPTLADRSIRIPLKRKRRNEHVERWRITYEDSLTDLRRMIRRWVEDQLATLAQADPAVPARLHDRAADNWRPLLAIADAAGGEWPTRARQAIAALETLDADNEDLGTMLLWDLREVFAATQADRLSSADICEALAGLEDRPWPTLSHGKPITPHRLARMLTPYGIVPINIRVGDKVPKGYSLKGCRDAFTRYTPLDESATPLQGATDAAPGDSSNRYTTGDVADPKRPQMRL